MSESGSPERLELRVTYAPTYRAPSDLLVRAQADATIAVLARALAEQAGDGAGGELYSDRGGRLAPDLTLGDGLIRDGDVLRPAATAADSPRRARTGLELCVVGGPGAGRRIPLAPGPQLIGRGAGVAIHIDDPSLSREHARIDVDGSGLVTIADAGSRNGTSIDGRRLADGERCHLRPENHVEAGRSLLQIRPIVTTDDAFVRNGRPHVDFNRSPRIVAIPRSATIEVEPPPARPGRARLPLVTSLAPLALGVVMFLIVGEPTMLLFSALTPVMAVSSFLSDRRSGHKDYRQRLAIFRRRAAQLDSELQVARDEEVAERRAAAPDPATVAMRVTRLLPSLWERRRDDEDFLRLRLGTADQPADLTISFPDGGDPHEREPVEARIRASTKLPSVPIAVDLTAAGGIGLCGDPVQSDALGRWLVIQAAVLHSPRELICCAVLSAERSEESWSWLAWLPHAAPTRTVIDHPNVAVGSEQGDALLRALVSAAELRRDERRHRFVRDGTRPAVLLVVDEATSPSRALVDDLLTGAQEADLVVVWLGHHRRELPGGCATVAELAVDRAAMDVSWPRESRAIQGATPDGIDVTLAEEVARTLAPVRDVTQSRAAGNIPRSAPLLDVLGLGSLSPAALAARWDAAPPGTLQAPLGRSADGRFTIDLRRDGPHGLIAGTTGAGKSELLQALVAGMAASHPPTRVSFLFVDYKGGTAFKDCVALPHTVGMVTDLDEHLTRRVLLSLNAELRRREHLLNDTGARDLLQLEQRRPDEAPPALVIVVDEFAALKQEIPEFVDGIVDIAQRGRSLGVHLLLATQRPGGVVSDNIRANTNLRIALRVAETNESEDVIGDRAAARISRATPGRAWVKTGPGELTEVQTAYGGGHSAPLGDPDQILITELAHGEPLVAAAAGEDADDAGSDLELLVDGLVAAAQLRGLERPTPPWLPPLPESLPLDAVGTGDAPHVVVVGRTDEPRRQRQSPWTIDLERDGSVLVYGTSGAGKTMLLQTVAAQLARASSPRHLHLYGLDFAGHGLHALRRLQHCGDVIGADDHEGTSRLLSMLVQEIDVRGRRFAEAGAGTLAEYRAIADEPDWPPRIVILLDSYAGFTSAYDMLDGGALPQTLQRVIAEGRARGVHVIATADRRNAVPPPVLALVSQRIVLRLASEDEYPTLGLDRKGVEGATLPPGRGFVDDTVELQVALADLAQEVPATAGDGEGAPAIPRMPERVARADLPLAADPARPVLGVEEAGLTAVTVDLRDAPFLICGPYRSGRTTALGALVDSMLQADPQLELHLLLPRRSGLVALGDRAASVARGAEACAESARALQELVDGRSPDARHPLCVVIVDDVDELADPSAATAGLALEAVLRRGRDVNVRVVASCETTQARSFSSLLRELRKDGNGLLLEPNVDVDGDLLGVRLPRRSRLDLPPGRGFLVDNGLPVLVQVVDRPL